MWSTEFCSCCVFERQGQGGGSAALTLILTGPRNLRSLLFFVHRRIHPRKLWSLIAIVQHSLANITRIFFLRKNNSYWLYIYKIQVGSHVLVLKKYIFNVNLTIDNTGLICLSKTANTDHKVLSTAAACPLTALRLNIKSLPKCTGRIDGIKKHDLPSTPPLSSVCLSSNAAINIW